MPKKITKPQTAKPLTIAPPVPADLSGDYAREYWRRISEQLIEIQGLTELHLEPLESLCHQWQEYKTQTQWAMENPQKLIVEYATGHLAPHPRVKMRQTAYDNLTKLWPKFGLTPESLAKMGKGNPNFAPQEPRIIEFARGKYA